MTARPKKSSAPASRVQTRRTPRMRALDAEFSAVKSEGGLLPLELLAKIAARDPSLPGVRDEDYQLMTGERLNEKVAEVWAKLKRSWAIFQQKRATLPANDYGTTLTRSTWLKDLFKALGYDDLRIRKDPIALGDKEYAISHVVAEPIALHLVSFRQDLDRRDDNTKTSMKKSPHSLMQEFLNRCDAYLWGVVTNGLKFRVLRDNDSLSRAAYLEFDLETMLNADAYGEFFLFYLVAHKTRFEKQATPDVEEEETEDDAEDAEEGAAPKEVDTEAWIERWRRYSVASGTRALDELAGDVVVAINALGKGFIERRENKELNEKLRSGVLDKQDYYRQLLRLVYRIVFVLIAEDRNLFFAQDAPKEIRALYNKFYSVSRIRALSRRARAGRHCDLWEQLERTLAWCYDGKPELGIPAFGSSLFDPEFTPDLKNCKLGNTQLLTAIRALTHTNRNNILQPVDYRNLGAEELGSVYESLLEMRPEIGSNNEFTLSVVAGNERKTTGSFYTPTELVASLLDSALEPTVDDALAKLKPALGFKTVSDEQKKEAILNLKVCDPSCGGGSFLVGAARRLARRIAQIETSEEEPSPGAIRTAMLGVITRCLYGVDINPMAVELCKVSLWIETMQAGSPLAFLDHHIKRGNSLLGTWEVFLKDGIPDTAFEEIAGDDGEICSMLKKENKSSRKDADVGQRGFFEDVDDFLTAYKRDMQELRKEWSHLTGSLTYKAQQQRYARLIKSDLFTKYLFFHHLWCVAFVKPKTMRSGNVTNFLFRNAWLEFDKAHNIENASFQGKVDFKSLEQDVAPFVKEYQFFHWHLEFPDVFDPEHEERSGFDVILGNPPWETLELKEKEYFYGVSDYVYQAKTAAIRKARIKELETTNPDLYKAYSIVFRYYEGIRHFMRDSGRFPLCSMKRINSFAVFAELNREIVAPTGRVGCIVPSGLASDDTTKFFFQSLVAKNALLSLYDFENRKSLFPGVHRSYKFSLLTLGGDSIAAQDGARLSFFNLSVAELKEKAAEKVFTLAPSEIALLNPNTRTCPVFRTTRDAELTKAVYRRAPILIREANESQKEENPWGIRFMQMFNMSTHSYLFHERAELEAQGCKLQGAIFRNPETKEEFWPLYEGKMIHLYNHRFSDLSVPDVKKKKKSIILSPDQVKKLQNPKYTVLPRYWIAREEVEKKIPIGTRYLIGWRNITNTTNQRTTICGLTAPVAFGHSYQVIIFNDNRVHNVLLYSDLSSFVRDYIVRQKLGGTNMSYFIVNQLVTLPHKRYDEPIEFAYQSINQSIN
ncbi:MAG: N-6 DNA methylase, partial [Thermoguttaceae bacterium]|nr:N-6 DNA methylase [Thermoguttaceae bacterium]